MGPTGAGKTDLAVELVERLGCGIVSVDSALVYRGMDIGTAKPGPEVLGRAPHRLIDIRDPAEPYSAAEFRRDALAAMAEVQAEGRVPLLVGGTGLYFRALERGLSALPPAAPEVRRRLAAEAAVVGWPALHQRLAALDPAAAARVHPRDAQRIQRALEVREITGRPMSALLGPAAGPALPYRVAKVVLEPADRAALHARLEARLQAMLEAGFEAEVEHLRARGDLSPELSSMRAVGYRQVWACLAGETDRETMIARALAATRGLAKRQLTWLRDEPQALRVDPFAPDALQKVLRFLALALNLEGKGSV
jgi:tRNA dimethylallyltransferase